MSQLILKYRELESLDKPLIDNIDYTVFEDAINFIDRWNSGDSVFDFNTSGSTGKPKVIKLDRWKMELSAQRTIDALGLSENQTALLCMSPQFIGGAMMIVRALMARMNLIIVLPSRQPLEHLTESFDFTAMVPMQLTESLKSGTKEQLRLLNGARHVLLGGAGVSNELLQQIAHLPTKYWSTYGMTETVSHVAIRELNGPSPTNNFDVLDSIEIKSGSDGQLCIRDRITDNQWLETNDIVKINSPRQFEWLGRLDNVINTGGVKVMAEKVEQGIEAIMQQTTPSSRYFIAGMPDDIYGSAVTLFLENSSEIGANNLLRKIKQRSTLSKYEFPKRLITLASFPETASGKVDKQRILKSQS